MGGASSPKQSPAVQPAVESDIEAITNIINEAVTRDIFRRPDCPRIEAEEVRTAFFTPGYTWYVIKTPDIEGIDTIRAVLLYTSKQESTTAKTRYLCASTKCQGLGYAKLLREAADQRAIADGKTRLTFHVANVNEKLIRYYEGMGFKVIEGKVSEYLQDVLLPDWQGKGEDGQPKVRVIKMEKKFVPIAAETGPSPRKENKSAPVIEALPIAGEAKAISTGAVS